MASKLSGVAGAKRALQPPSPSPSNASNASHGGTPSKRLKREEGRKRMRDQATPTPAAIAASQTSHGDELLTKLSYAVDFLKAKGAPKTLQEILDHLTLQHASEKQQRQFASLMKKNHPAINFVPAAKSNDQGGWRLGSYEFRAKIPGVKSKTTLLEYLQRKTDASKLDVKLLKDGWPDCDKDIDELEAAHKILVVRTKKDGHAKYIWSDQPSLFHPVDPEFRVMWQRVKLPDLDDIVRKLTAVGQKPASEDPRLKAKITEKAAKPKRKVNRSKKRQTNEHMNGILKDYSHLKKG
jgi:transcription initiation factor TFIIE subunit beta